MADLAKPVGAAGAAEALRLGLVRIDDAMTVVDADERACALTTIAREEFVGRRLDSVATPRDGGTLPERLRLAWRAGLDTLVLFHAGERDVLCRAVFVLTDSGWTAWLDDLSRDEHPLRDATLLARAVRELVVAIPTAVAVLDPALRVEQCNARFADIVSVHGTPDVGVTPAELRGRSAADLLKTDDFAALVRTLSEPFPHSWWFKGRTLGIDGSVAVSLRPIATAGVGVGGALLTLEDLSAEDELRATTQALRHSERKYRELYDGVPDMLLSIDPETLRVVACNHTVERVLGYTRDELIGRSLSELYHPDSHQYWRDEVVREFRESGRVRDAELKVTRKDGSTLWVSLNASAVRDARGRVVASTSSWRDISDWKAAETRLEQSDEELRRSSIRLEQQNEDLRLARDAAEAANRAKSRFLANISHELRTPLNAVIGYAELIAEEAELERFEEVKEDVGKIQQSGTHLLDLINGILDLSRIEAGTMSVDLEVLEVEPLVASVVDALRPAIERGRNTIEVRIDAGVTTIRTDRTRLRQILLNLLSNAANFTSEGTVAVDVVPDPDETGWMTFAITDTGVGIPLEHQQTVFLPFHQVDMSTTRTVGGTGLGLAITRSNCQMLGGWVELASEMDVGTCVRVHLPSRPVD